MVHEWAFISLPYSSKFFYVSVVLLQLLCSYPVDVFLIFTSFLLAFVTACAVSGCWLLAAATTALATPTATTATPNATAATVAAAVAPATAAAATNDYVTNQQQKGHF